MAATLQAADYTLQAGGELKYAKISGFAGLEIFGIPFQIQGTLRAGVALKASLGKKTGIHLPLFGVEVIVGQDPLELR